MVPKCKAKNGAANQEPREEKKVVHKCKTKNAAADQKTPQKNSETCHHAVKMERSLLNITRLWLIGHDITITVKSLLSS